MRLARSVPWLVVATLGASLAACGGGDDDGGGGADGGGGGADAGPDLGGWQVERATTTEGTISHDGALAVMTDGTVWMAFAEPDTSGSGGNIFVASRDQVGWSTATALTQDPVQQAFPAMSADGDAIDLVWSGRLEPEDFNDLFHARYENGAWSARVNLTAAFESDAGRHAYQPVVARRPTGELVIAYLSGAAIGDAEVRVGILDEGALVAEPVTALAPGGEPCDDPAIAVDQAGIVHVAASCGPLFAGDAYYSNDAGGGGTFAGATRLPSPEGQDDVSPALAIGGDGFTALVAWTTGTPCGEDVCGEIVLSARSSGAFGDPVAVSGTTDASEATPVMGVGGDGTVHVAFHRFNADNFADVVVASGDGATFAETVLTPGTDGSDEWLPYGMTIAPTGEPHFTFVQIVAGSEPLDSEVWHAYRE